MPHLLGLDIGSTVVKATVFDRRGRIVAAAAEPSRIRHPHPGWVERDAEETWQTAAAVIKRAVSGRALAIGAVGVTGCGNGAVFLDRRKRPLLPGILSSDTRAARLLGGSSPARGQRSYPGQLPVLIRWLRETNKRAASQMGHALFWKDYIRYRLTDTLTTDYTDAGAAGLLAYPKRELCYSDPGLPEVRESLAQGGTITRVAARATKLKAGTPVFVGCIDCEAAAIGSGVRGPGEICVVAGTWSINQSYTARPPRASHFLVNASVLAKRWLVLEGSAGSVGNFEWARHVFGVDLTIAARDASRASTSELLFLPQVPTSAGAFIGLGPTHGRGDLLRAVMEGVVFAHRSHLDVLARSIGRWKRLYLTGGASRNRFWCQLFADVLGCAVHVPRNPEVGTLGAAICAAVGAGYFTSVTAAQKALVSSYCIYHPHTAPHAAFTQKYQRYVQLIRRVSK